MPPFFLAVDRYPKGDWKSILESIGQLLGNEQTIALQQEDEGQGLGEAHVYVQMFRNIPLQVRVKSGGEEARLAMPERFNDAVMKVIEASPTLLKERKLVDKGVRYGELQEIAEQTVQELDASYSDEELAKLAERALQLGEGQEEEAVRKEFSREEIDAQFASSDWRQRYAALDHLKQPGEQDIPLLAKALSDEHGSIRRLAVALSWRYRGQEGTALLVSGT